MQDKSCLQSNLSCIPAWSTCLTAVTAFSVCIRKMDNSVVLLPAVWRHMPASLCPKPMCPFDPLQQCKKVSQLVKVYRLLHALHTMQQIQTHVQPACGAAFVGVCGIKRRCTARLILATVCILCMLKLAFNQACARFQVSCMLWYRKQRAVMRTLTGQSREPCKGPLQLRRPLQLLW